MNISKTNKGENKIEDSGDSIPIKKVPSDQSQIDMKIPFLEELQISLDQ